MPPHNLPKLTLMSQQARGRGTFLLRLPPIPQRWRAQVFCVLPGGAHDRFVNRRLNIHQCIMLMPPKRLRTSILTIAWRLPPEAFYAEAEVRVPIPLSSPSVPYVSMFLQRDLANRAMHSPVMMLMRDKRDLLVRDSFSEFIAIDA